MEKIKIICIPFAGGSSYSLQFLEKEFHQGLEYISVNSPGKGKRSREEPLQDLHKITDDIYEQIIPYTCGSYALYGHSMGGKICYLLAKRLISEGKRLPMHLFISSCNAPCISYKNTLGIELPNDLFVERLKLLGGMPLPIIENKDSLEYFIRIIRCDFIAVENYAYQESRPFEIPITIITGDEENFKGSDIAKWQKETIKKINQLSLSGNHFFIYQHAKSLAELFEQNLLGNNDKGLLG